MIHREEARLRSLFQRLLLVSTASSLAACSSAESAAPNDASAPGDATTQNKGSDAASDADDASIIPDATTPADGASTADGALDTGAFDALDPYGFLDSACDPEYVDGASQYGDGGADSGLCSFSERLPCGLPPGTQTEGCNLLVAQCGTLCSYIPTLYRVCAVSECLAVDASTVSDAASPLLLECAVGGPQCGPGVGRRPRGLSTAVPQGSCDAVGAVLAEMAHLEAASVHAFERLGEDLTSIQAPRALVRQAERAARDEVRHARVTARLARRRGAEPAPVVIEQEKGPRSVADLALENAVEGCVRESFGALVAMRQASHARDSQVARAMARIARDETRHAALAWALARWVAPRLDGFARSNVRRAVRSALASLRCATAQIPGDVAGELGLPTGAEGRGFVDAFAVACFTKRA